MGTDARGGIDSEGLIEFTRALVRIPSVNQLSEGLGEGPAAALVADRMRAFGWSPVVEEAAPERPNVIAVLDGGRPGPTLMFEGHTDVVTRATAPPGRTTPSGARSWTAASTGAAPRT